MDTEILGRLVNAGTGSFDPAFARWLLSLRFEDADTARMNELASRARDGKLSADQRQEADSYNRIGHLVATLQSKARCNLKAAPDGAHGS